MHLLADIAHGCLNTATVLCAMVFFGVALPAVWSRKRTRREAAAAVLRQILDYRACRPRGRGSQL